MMFTENSIKNSQGYCQPTKGSVCYKLPLHAHDEDRFQHPQSLQLYSGTHREWILNRDENYNENYQKLISSQNIQSQKSLRFAPASNQTKKNTCLNPKKNNFQKNMIYSKKKLFKNLKNPQMLPKNYRSNK